MTNDDNNLTFGILNLFEVADHLESLDYRVE